MIDLTKLVILFDAAAKCGDRDCEHCKSLFKTGTQCPLWINKDNTLEALKAVEKHLDDIWDNSSIVTNEEFVKILTE